MTDPTPGKCRICGCTEDRACVDDLHATGCGWADSTRTLCDREVCMTAAARVAGERARARLAAAQAKAPQ